MLQPADGIALQLPAHPALIERPPQNRRAEDPLQPDLQYRGFTASPLLGLAQGLAVYQNGVRINEPLGDTINWDLIPQGAISSMNLIPGSNPVFGLNTLGGALGLDLQIATQI